MHIVAVLPVVRRSLTCREAEQAVRAASASASVFQSNPYKAGVGPNAFLRCQVLDLVDRTVWAHRPGVERIALWICPRSVGVPR